MGRQHWTVQEIREQADEGPPLANLLPWRWVEPDALPIHALADGSLGLAWQCPLADVELKDESDFRVLHAALQHFLHQLPPGVAFQTILLQWPTIAPALARWKARRAQGHPIVDRVVAARERHLTALAADGFFAAKTLTLLLTLRWWPPGAARGRAVDAIAPFGALGRARTERQRALGELTRLTDNVGALGRMLGGALTPLDGEGFLALAWRMLNPGVVGAPPRWDPYRPLHDQAIETAATFRPEGFTLGGFEGRTLSVLGLPSLTRTGHLTLAPDPGGAPPLLAQPGFQWLTISGTTLEPDAARGELHRKKFFAWSQRTDFLGDTRMESARMHEEAGAVIDQAFAEGLRLCRASFRLTVLDRPDLIQSRVEQTLGALAQLEFRALREHLTATPLFLEGLPFGYDPWVDRKSARRGRRLLSRNLADLLPFCGSYGGTPTPAQLFLGRHGAPVFFDPFDSPVGPHMTISGVTGSGKSFAAVDLCLQQLSAGADVVVLDKGDSYRRLVTLFGGQYLAVDPDTIPTINPCYGPGDNDHQLFVSAVLGEMASRGVERFQLDPEADGLLARAVAEAFATPPPEGEVTLGHIARILGREEFNPDGLGRRLVRMLFPFLRGGPSGRCFDGPNAFEVRPGLTVIELKDVERSPALQTVIVMVLLHLVTAFLGRRPRGQRKFLVVDEAWNLLHSRYGAAVLAVVARTYRKINTAAIFISQFLSDFDDEAGGAVRDNCPNRLFLRYEIDTLRRYQGMLGLSDRQLEALGSATNVIGRFSEGLLVTPGGRTMVRVVTDPVTYWTATTHPSDIARWEAALATAGGDVATALDSLVKGGPSP